MESDILGSDLSLTICGTKSDMNWISDHVTDVHPHQLSFQDTCDFIICV